MNNEEELDINGVSGPAPQVDQNKMEAHHAHLDVGPGASNEAVLDAILAAPTDQLLVWEDCVLPSRGLYYDWPDGVCKVRPMGQIAEKILATQRLAASGQSITYLFKECCRFPNNFDPDDLLLGDRVFLLYYLRGITHGNIYEFAVTCPNAECGSVNTYNYDLNDLSATIRPADPSLGKEPFKVLLPYLSSTVGRDVWVSLRFLRAYDANDIIASRRAKKQAFAKSGGVRSKAQEVARQRAQEAGELRRNAVDSRMQNQQEIAIDNSLDDNLEKMIVNVMGIDDRFKIRALVQRLHSKDTATIREWLREHTPGIDSTVEIVCSSCNNEFKVELPITEGFFRPAKS